MKFAAITIGVGIVGALLASSLQSPAKISGDGLPADVVVDPTITGSIVKTAGATGSGAVRLIDLKSGASCKTVTPPDSGEISAAPLGADCAKSPSLSRIAYWRAAADGSLIMADRSGKTVLEFAPGDGVLYESVYPANELVTIVPARG
ncbi:hypothetical protein GCM10011390_50780 [Aureimonas endophytica]|uniref:Alkaline phosphatase n=1 Tax=Aureimonas endophytica TaxID=2027858 RepID=A0A917A3Z6_9HYPH|nr:hypothetical protein [Aureimonas endophytica]GGE25162.1 hypothetical protein GCM10011390_50780 [Aureimonas endophytica]